MLGKEELNYIWNYIKNANNSKYIYDNRKFEILLNEE